MKSASCGKSWSIAAIDTASANPPSPSQPAAPQITHVNIARGFRGGERQTELLIRELDALGYRQRLVARKAEPLIVRLADLAHLDRRPVAGIPSAVRAVRGSDLIHIHEGRAIQAAALANVFFGHRYVVTRREIKPIRDHAITRSMYRRADVLVGLSSAISNQLAEYVPGQTVETIPSAYTGHDIDKERVRALRQSFGDRPVVGHVGALVTAHKGQMMLLQMAKQRPQYTFVLAGSGRDEALLKETARDLPNVIFAGQVSDVHHYLAAFDIFAFPSRHEGLGSTLLDAMAAELPIAASITGGIPDIIRHGENGLLVEPDDESGWLTAIDQLIKDGPQQLKFANANRQRISEFSAEAMGLRYHALYARLFS